MAEQLNPDQRRAVEHEGSLVLTAGAGSGKTSVLVVRYLRHLAEGTPVAALAAITFTEKAAREMRQRIRAAVRQRLRAASPGSREHALWRSAALHLEVAAIDTIHGFCSKLLRRFAQQAELDPTFQVLEETAARMLRTDAVAASMRTLLQEQSSEGADLREIIVLYGWNDTRQLLAELLHNPDRDGWQAFVHQPAAQVARVWAAAGADFMHTHCARLLAQPEIIALEQVQAATEEGEALLERVRGMIAVLRAAPAACDLAELQTVAQVGHHTQAKRLYGNANYPVVRDGFRTLREVAAELQETHYAHPPEHLPAAAEVGQRIARVALRVAADFAQRKRQANVLDFHDLLVLSRNLLRDHESVRRQVQEEIRFLLMDELQDTDPLQMELAEWVLGPRWLAGGLFAVGDVKQSIYRFRNAEVALFESLRARVLPAGRHCLASNYRSRPGLLRFVNTLSRTWFPNEPLLIPTRDEVPPPLVEFLWSVPNETGSDALRTAEAHAIAQRIRELTRGPQACPPGDIVLLLRALTDVSVYESALLQAGIDYYLVGGRAFFAQQEIYDLHNALAAVENPNDSLSLAGALRAPFFCLSDDALLMLSTHPDGLWAGLMAEPPQVPAEELSLARQARRALSTWRAMKDSVPIAWLVQRLLADTGYDGALIFEPLGPRKLANLWKLQSLARDFDARRQSLAEFTAFLRELVSTQPREEQAATLPEEAENVVRIMTIHQAKGLEFPVVFVPDLGRQSTGPRWATAIWHRRLGLIPALPQDSEESDVAYPAWPWKLAYELEKDADQLESLRQLYVACTRAKERLILSSGVTINNERIAVQGVGLQALAQAYDLDTGQPLQPDGEPAHVTFIRDPPPPG